MRAKERAEDLGAFANAAGEFGRLKLAAIPLTGADGKSPSIAGFNGWSRYPSPKTYAALCKKFPSANIGLLTGPINRLTVLDIDDPDAVERLLALAGDTPVKVVTPSGGLHACYRYSGERCANLRPDFDADLKSIGGYVVAPPSRRFSDRAPYSFVSGGFEFLDRIPRMRPFFEARPENRRTAGAQRGNRNDTLFKLALKQAAHADTLDDLLDVARTINDDFPEPLPDAEVVKTAASAWDYESRGENWNRKGKRMMLFASAFDAYRDTDKPEDAVFFDILLRRHHKEGDVFAVSPHAMSGNAISWGPKRIRVVRDILERIGTLQRVRKGGRGVRDPHLFRLCSVPASKGANPAPNSNCTPPPSRLGSREIDGRSATIISFPSTIEKT